MKRNTKAIDILREYICRNSREQEVPPGYISKHDIKKMLGCSENQFTRISRQLSKMKMLDRIVLRRVIKGRIYTVPFFRFDKKISAMIGLSTR